MVLNYLSRTLQQQFVEALQQQLVEALQQQFVETQLALPVRRRFLRQTEASRRLHALLCSSCRPEPMHHGRQHLAVVGQCAAIQSLASPTQPYDALPGLVVLIESSRKYMTTLEMF